MREKIKKYHRTLFSVNFPRYRAKYRIIANRLRLKLRGFPTTADSEINTELIKMIVGKENPTILEIGAAGGGHTLWFLKAFQNPKIYCFEPEPRAIARFKKTVGNHPNVCLFEIAFSDKNGVIDFYPSGGNRDEAQAQEIPEGWFLSGSIRPPKEHLVLYPWVTFQPKVQVKTETLDDWCEKNQVEKIDFIWMDVQGAEVDVFKGGAKILKKTRYIYTEYSNLELYSGQENLRQLLRRLKIFSVVCRYSCDVLLKNKRI